MTSTNDQQPSWIINTLDVDGPWGWRHLIQSHIWEALHDKLSNFEKMTWSEIEKNRKYNHSVEVWNLSTEAQNRLRQIKNDNIGELFRFRLNGKQRLWGIRDRAVFKILWWDPEHEVCPSTGADN